MERKLLIISYGKYPNGNAGAVRQHTFAKLFMDLGYEVNVIGMGDSTNFQLKEYEGVKYISFRKEPNTITNRALNWLAYGNRLKTFLKSHGGYTDILFIKTYFEPVLSYIKRYAKKNNIKLYHDSVEWYSPEEFAFGKLSLGYIKNNRMNTKLIDQQFNVVAISKYLENHYKGRGIHTIRVPVIMDKDSITPDKSDASDKVVVSYAGRIGKKDYIANILKAFLLLGDEEKTKIEFRLMGANLEQVSKITGISQEVLNANSNLIHCMGRVPREVVLDNLRETDFTILIRDASLRYAKAGFPTKVVESLMSGTPVICNLSSDLGDYLIDGCNSIISESIEPENICKAIRRAANLSSEKRNKMKLEARDTAEKCFDYRNYIDVFQKWSNEQ